jgi:uncharacterized protein with GYD domain
MPMYVGLYKLTEKGAGDIKNAPERIKGLVKVWEAMGGTTSVVVATLGAYDYITVGEAPSDEVAATFAAALASQGYVTTETMRAFKPEEFAGILAKLP